MIVAVVIIWGIICFVVSSDLNKEYKKYGYSSFNDNIKYDTWTGEIIPKQEINTFNNDNKYITNSKGEQIKFTQIKELIKQFGNIQGNYASFTGDKVRNIDTICNTLLKDYLDLNYEIINYGESSNNYVLQIRGEYEKSYYSEISNPAELEGLVQEVVKDKYRSQNGLENK